MRRFFVLILWTFALIGTFTCVAMDIRNLLPVLAGIVLTLTGVWYTAEVHIEERRAAWDPKDNEDATTPHQQ